MPIVLAVVAMVGIVAGVALARRLLLVVRVNGVSMAPALRPGQRLLVLRAPLPLRAGAIVVFREPGQDDQGSVAGWVVKRAVAVAGDSVPEPVRPAVGGATTVPAGMVVVLGDGMTSADSRLWGFLPARAIAGRVVATLGTAASARQR